MRLRLRPQTGRVHEPERAPLQGKQGLDRIARRARELGDYCALLPKQRIENTRLTNIWPASDHRKRPVAKQLAFRRLPQQSRQGFAQLPRQFQQPLAWDRTLILFGEVDVVGQHGLERQ